MTFIFCVDYINILDAIFFAISFGPIKKFSVFAFEKRERG